MAKKVTAKKVTAKKAKTEKVKEVKGKSGRKYAVITHGLSYWQPEVGESFEGTFVEMMEKTGGEFGTQRINPKTNKKELFQEYAVVENEKGEQVGMASTHNMNKFFKDMKKGEYFMVTYNGKKSIGAGKNVHDYTFAKEM